MFNPDLSNILPGELFDEDFDPCLLHENADYLLNSDPEFLEICDSRRDEMFSWMEENS